MRSLILLLTLLGIAACNPKGETERADKSAREAALTYDGGDYQTPSAKLAHGQRLARALGCNSCHGSNYQGGQFPPQPGWGSIHSSNLTQLAGYSDEQLERTIRTVVRRDGRELWLMPSHVYQHLSSADMAALVSHLQSLPPRGDVHPSPVFGEGAKAEIASGGMKPPSQLVPDYKVRTPVDLGKHHAFGRYIAMTVCSGCHGAELEGMEDFAPDLMIAGAYTLPEFETLLTTGKPNGSRKLGLMAESAEKHFAHMTSSERAALWSYLKARADRPM
jgi:mono/diheme cytochrome c family protein